MTILHAPARSLARDGLLFAAIAPLGKGSAAAAAGDRENRRGAHGFAQQNFGFISGDARNKKPRRQGGPAGLGSGTWGGVFAPGSLQGRERSATGVAPVATYMTIPHMDGS